MESLVLLNLLYTIDIDIGAVSNKADEIWLFWRLAKYFFLCDTAL